MPIKCKDFIFFLSSCLMTLCEERHLAPDFMHGDTEELRTSVSSQSWAPSALSFSVRGNTAGAL